MTIIVRSIEDLRRLFLRLSIFDRVLLGNSLIIISSALAGTLLIHRLALLGNMQLIILFSFSGILIVLFLNYVIIRAVLLPLHELTRALEQVSLEQIKIPASLENLQNPDMHLLVQTIDAALSRLANRTRQLQALSERTINAQEEERGRIARSLHDDTAQSIAMLIINLEKIGTLIPPGNASLLHKVNEAHQAATLLLENLRKVIWDMRPSILDDLGLIPAIRWYAQTHLKEAGMNVEVGRSDEALRLPQYLETILFRITQEAVSNIIRHAEASEVFINLRTEGSYILLEIRDNGRGFDVEKTRGEALNRKQLGLLGMQERVSLVSGSVQIQSTPGTGTTLTIKAPLPIEDAMDAARDSHAESILR